MSGFGVGIQDAGVKEQVRVSDEISTVLLAQRGHLFAWVPVFLGAGIGLWFVLRFEPGLMHYATIAVIAAFLLGISRFFLSTTQPIWVALALILVGLLLIGARAHLVAAPTLNWRYYGPIEGRVVLIDRSVSDKIRLTLDQVTLERLSPDRTPDRIRISLHGDDQTTAPEPGTIIATTGHLSPPSGPVEPGGFDFQRMAWFQSLGAVGYSRNPVMVMSRDEAGRVGLGIYRIRVTLSTAIRQRMEGETGAFAAAITTGDRSSMSHDSLNNLRASNLAHLLAISGLHMGLLTGFVFGLIRYGMAAIPRIALRWPTKKIAAAVSLVVAATYLGLSGGNVSTERAFIMVSVMLVAILLNRRALTLRAVAIAAIIVLIRRPEQLTGPGFQMSFAATTALVAIFGALRQIEHHHLPRWAKPMAAVFLSSLVAGLATAPISAAHFNQISHFGLVANLLSVPVMGIVVMPCAVLAACLWPIGLAAIGLWGMELGLLWILKVADYVANTDGALGHVVSPDPIVLPLIAGGALFIILWQGRSKGLGLIPMITAFWLWTSTERPTILVSETGGLIGVMTYQGRVLSNPRGDGFSARSWLENDGVDISQFEAAQGFSTQIFRDAGMEMRHIRGKRQADSTIGCDGADIVIMNTENQQTRNCQVFDSVRLRETGSLAVDPRHREITTARNVTGDRMWNTPTLNPIERYRIETSETATQIVAVQEAQ